MTCTRRSFFTASSAALAGLCLAGRGSTASVLQRLGGQRWFEDTYFDWSKVAENSHVATGEGGNVLALVGKAQTVVIDAKNGGFGAALRREASALGAPVSTLINTHHHFDHTGGNPAFTKDLTVVAHANMAKRVGSHVDRSIKSAQGSIAQLKQSPKPAAKQVIADIEEFLKSNPTEKSFLPTQPIPSSGSFSFAGISFELYHVGPGHTDNDLIVFIPDRNILHGGDLLFNKTWPYVDIASSGADTAGWIASCERILELANDKTVIIPGHGAVGDVEMVKRQIAFFKHMRQVAADAVGKGTSREDFLKLSPDEYKDYALADFIKPVTLGGLWDEAKKASTK